MSSNDRFFDDSTDDIQPIPPVPPIEPIQPIPPIEPINPSEEPKPVDNIIQPIITNNVSENKSNSYLNIIKEYESSIKKDPMNGILDDTYKKPIYNFYRDPNTGTVSITTKSENVIVENDTVVEDQSVEIKELIEKANKDLKNTSLEIRIYSELIKNEGDPIKQKTYQNTLQCYKNDYDYYQKRISILKKMIGE